MVENSRSVLEYQHFMSLPLKFIFVQIWLHKSYGFDLLTFQNLEDQSTKSRGPSQPKMQSFLLIGKGFQLKVFYLR